MCKCTKSSFFNAGMLGRQPQRMFVTRFLGVNPQWMIKMFEVALILISARGKVSHQWVTVSIFPQKRNLKYIEGDTFCQLFIILKNLPKISFYI